MSSLNLKYVDIIRQYYKDRDGLATLYDCLAEELVELAKEALKMSRVMRGINPTPISLDEAKNNFDEEYNDVRLVMKVLGYPEDEYLQGKKLDRWFRRIDQATDGYGFRQLTFDAVGDSLLKAQIRAENDILSNEERNHNGR